MTEHKCSVSTGIHGGLTFGYGNLDEYGYWEFPCNDCARNYEKCYPNERCWPFVDNGNCADCGNDAALACICYDYDSEATDPPTEVLWPEPLEQPVYNCRLCGEYKCGGH